MELSFVTSALRRYWWVVVLMALLGAVPGLLLGGSSGPPEFESRAVMLVSAPTDGGSDPTRYLSGQLSILRSEAMANDAAAVLDDGSTAGDVGPNVRIDNDPQTDVVAIVARSTSPERATAMAQAYLDAYRLLVSDRVAGSQAERLSQLNEQIDAKEAELDAVVSEIEERMAPYANVTPQPLQEQVAPREVAQYDQIFDDLSGLRAARVEVESAQTRTGVEVVQNASEPSEPVATPPNTLLVIGVVGGAMAGVVGAVLLARLSPNVLGNDQAEEVLRHPVVGTLPTLPGLTADRTSLFDVTSPDAYEVIEALCVRAETMGHDQGAVSIVVIGTERGAGTTTVATLVARRYADGGARTLLVDADRRDPELTGLAASHLDLVASTSGEVGTTTTLPDLRFLNVRDLSPSSGGRPRSTSVGEVLRLSGEGSDIVVFDAGPVMESAGSLRLARIADAVILVMPKRQRAVSLDTVAAELRGRPLLPVWGASGERSRFLRRSRTPSRRRTSRPTREQIASDLDAELISAGRRDEG